MSRAILLTCEGEFGRIAANYLAPRFPGLVTVIDAPLSRLSLLRGRARRKGATVAAGQAAFMAFQRLQRLYSGARIEAIKRAFGLDSGAIATEVKRLGDVNGEACRSFLSEQRPSVVLVMGTRLIEEATRRAANAPFVNYHAGITPKYRGVHGAYWARATGDAANCGVTVHLIDSGIDTGAILYQARIVPERPDNFSTYPYLQLAAGLPLLARAGEDAASAKLAPINVDLPSKLWSHPTLWSYLAAGLGRGAW
jgi:folate-dependent phosphoribosylglycinamide formyltransferase PurN